MKNLIFAAIFLGAFFAIAEGKSDETNCTFEAGVCDWVNAGIQEWLWTSADGAGPADKPPRDVTLASVAGHYVYAELSSTNPDEPTFVSPEIQSGTYCGKLYFYSSDASVASLEASILSPTGARTNSVTVTNTVDGQWVQASMDIHENDAFKIELTAKLVDGTSTAVVALDEFHLVHGHCH